VPKAFLVLTAIAALEGVALVVYGIYDLIQSLRLGATGPADVSNLPALVLQIVIYLVLGVGMLLIADAWRRGRFWQRGAFMLGQIFAVVIGYEFIGPEGGIAWATGALLMVLGVAGLVLVFTPPVLRHFSQR